MACPLVSMSPVRREDEISETCRGDYCSMFEGICKNGGTCVSKGCKGECKCTSEFSGHNCEMPNTPVTTEAPKPKKEKKTKESRAKDFSIILSLFRMLQNRPEVNNVDKKTEAVKKEKESKSDKSKDGDKMSDTDNKRRENFPSRPESANDRKREMSTEKETHDSSKKHSTIKNTSQKELVRQSETTVIPIVINNSVGSRSANTPPGSITTGKTKQRELSTEPSVRNRIVNQVKNEKPVQLKRVSPDLHNEGNKKIKHSTLRNTKIPVTSSTLPTTFKTILKSSTDLPRTVSDSPSFSGKTGQLVQNVFHLPKRFTKETTTVSQSKPKSTMDKGKSNVPIALAQIASAGHNILSSTTLSNLYLSYSLLSKSRIFVSTVPNKFAKRKDLSTKNEITTTMPIEISNSNLKSKKLAKNPLEISDIKSTDIFTSTAKNIILKDESRGSDGSSETTIMLTSTSPVKQKTTSQKDTRKLDKTTNASFNKGTSQTSNQKKPTAEVTTTMASADVTTVSPTIVNPISEVVNLSPLSVRNKVVAMTTQSSISSDPIKEVYGKDNNVDLTKDILLHKTAKNTNIQKRTK